MQTNQGSHQVRNHVIIAFILALILILAYGVIVFVYSASSKQFTDNLLSSGQAPTGAQLQQINAGFDNISRASFIFLNLGIVVFFAIMLDLMFTIFPALERISNGIREVASGNSRYRIKLPVNNEFGQIASFFNEAIEKLTESEGSLTQALSKSEGLQEAMLNLLEDARDLEAELKTEKAGVEQKVLDRTGELEAQRRNLESIINGVNFGIYMLGPDLHINLVNQPMQDLYAKSHNEPYSLEALDTDVHNQTDSQADISVALKTRRPVRRAEFTRGSRLFSSFRSPIFTEGGKDSKLLGVINVIEDITDAKADERSRDEFFSIASHELRTPLTAIRGNTAMIMDYFGDQLKDPSLKEMIGDIHDSSIRLITIVNDFLNTSRLEQGKIEFKINPFDPADLITEVIKEFKAGDTGAKVPIEASLMAVPNVLADRDRLKEVLINLIGNAVKFTDTGAITVGLALEGKQVKFSVTDTGKGIPLESQNLLFRKFQQASNNILTRDSTRSTGLGLYICKLIVAGMGGDIFLERSEAGQGSTFAVLVPAFKAVKTKSVPAGVKS